MKYRFPDLASIVDGVKAECEDFVKDGVWHEWYNDSYWKTKMSININPDTHKPPAS